nr:PIG-L family deacetylase [Deinobacterium chartae]
MFIGAHPDDDGGIMGTFARYILDEGYKGTVITLTGGEGGGNATGRETGRSLGLIREEEERRSLNLIGVHSPRFAGLHDFYFTLSAEETLEKWGGDSFVCDVVRDVRLQRPEVIVTMWPGPGTHGQHQMAARAATLAFEHAGDPNFCPDLTNKEFLPPFTPLKLYYYPNDAKSATVAIPTGDYSRSARMRYADLKELALTNYRTQGYDQFRVIPAKEAAPERFMLVRSRVPVPETETHLLEGAVKDAATSPAGVRLEVTPAAYQVGQGGSVDVTVRFFNATPQPMQGAALSLAVPEGFTVTPVSGADVGTLEAGKEATAVFRVSATAGAAIDQDARLTARYSAQQGGRTLGGANQAHVRAVAGVQVSFKPTFDVAAYQDFARQTHTEWVIGSLPTRLPLIIGQDNEVALQVTNRGGSAARGTVTLELPKGITASGNLAYDLEAGKSAELKVTLNVDPSVLPEGRQSALVPLKAGGQGISGDLANVYALPALTLPRVTGAPKIDGDLSDMAQLAQGRINPVDLWWRKQPDSAADSSANFFAGWDADFLYVGVRVNDDAVVCNIAPDDVKAQLRSDAVGVTVDPSGASRDTSTTLMAAAFPCTTAGFGARGFRDADANQGLMEDTAPGMEVASRRTDTGYDIEFKIPWKAMPSQPQPGSTLGLNVVVYDGDLKDARVGANISESGLAWAAFSWGGKQALPYLWPRVTLGQ